MAKRKLTVHEAERIYQQAKTTEEKIKALELMLEAIPVNKATENVRLKILKRIAKLREELELQRQKEKSKGKRQLYVKKEASLMVSLFSFPNSGKSYFLNKFAGKSLESTEIPFETQKRETGIVNYKKFILQFVELPSVYEGYSEKYRFSFTIIRSSDAILSFLSKEYDEDYQKEVIVEELRKNNILVGKKPRVTVIREDKGGIKFYGDYIPEDVKPYVELLQAYRYHNATVYFEEPVSIEMFARVLDNSTKFIDVIFSKKNDEEAIERTIKELKIIRVYTKEPGKKPDFSEPVILKRGSTIRDLIEEINSSWLEVFRYARVWGKKVKFPGQKVGLDYELEDEDVVEFKLK